MEGETEKKPEEATEKKHGDKDEHKKKKKKDEAHEMGGLILPKVEKVVFKPLEKMTFKPIEPTKAPKEKVTASARVEADLKEVKPLKDKTDNMSLKEQHEREATELATSQFRDRNDSEHEKLREADVTLGAKLNELVETRPKDAETLKGHVLKVVGETKTSLMNTITELEAQNKAITEKYNDLVDASETQKTAMAVRETELEARDKTITDKYSELVDAFETQKTTYTEETGELRESITSLEAENEAINTRNGEMGVTIDGYKPALEALETRLGEYEEFKTANETEHTSFEERLVALEEFKVVYESDKEGIETQIAELTEKLGGVTSKLEEIEAEPKENPLKDEMDKLTEVVENLKTHVKPEFKAPENLGDAEYAPSVSLEVDPVKG